MSESRVALLRGINVGTAKRVAMGDLRKVFEALGYGDVRTLLNSGNVVFVSKEEPEVAAARIGPAFERKFGFTSRITVLSGKDVVAAVRDQPLGSIADDASCLLLMAPIDPKALVRLKPLLKERWSPEALALGTRVAYLWCAEGLVDSRLWVAASRALDDAVTARNLATMTKLAALIDGSKRT